MLHRPLHAAAYYLNPQMHYGNPKFKADIEVQKGFMDCLTRMVVDLEEQSKIGVQLHEFKKRRGYFGTPLAKNTLDKTSPAEWWDTFGIECPELQKFAIRILSLTCSSSGCERNWSAFEMVHTKRRNRLKQQTMNDIVFVMANSKLGQKKKARSTRVLNFDDIDSDDNWVMDVEDGGIEVLDDEENQVREAEDVQIVENLDDEDEEVGDENIEGDGGKGEGEDEDVEENEDDDGEENEDEDEDDGDIDPLNGLDMNHEIFDL